MQREVNLKKGCIGYSDRKISVFKSCNKSFHCSPLNNCFFTGIRKQAEMSGGIIEQPGRGYVKFSVPYLREHLREREQAGLRSLGIFKSSKKSPVFFFGLKTCRR